jgi:hypothetical protein
VSGVPVTDEVNRIYAGEIRLCRKPVFIVGAPRSGTTALARALASHSDFWTSRETLFLSSLFGGGRIETDFERWIERPGISWLRAQNVDRSEFLSYVGLGFNALFTSRSEGRRWIDHTPHHAFMVDVLAEMFPGASFLHIVRDGRAAVHSMLNLVNTLTEERRSQMQAGYFLPDWTRNFEAACSIWRESVEAAAAACERHPDRFLTVSYTRLATSPEEAFSEILDFLGAAFEDAPADYWSSTKQGSSFRGAAENEARLASGSRRWAEWLPEERAVFADLAGPTMVKHGLAGEGELDPGT